MAVTADVLINCFLYKQIKISALELPLFSGERVHCLDVLFALVKRNMGDVEISPEIKKQAENLLSKYFPNRKELEANTTTLILRNQIRAARLIQVNEEILTVYFALLSTTVLNGKILHCLI